MQSAQPSVSQAQPLGHSQQQSEGSENSQGEDQGRLLPSDGARRPLHRIDEEREGGFEKLQLILVGAAIVIALGLAYRAGRRRRNS
jgi:hypothetical protein